MSELTIDAINPIGYVESSWQDTLAIPLGGSPAIIHIQSEYRPGLYRIGEHSHLWVLSWFGQADRSVLQVVPTKVNPDLPPCGVFGLRTAVRPNPIALTLVQLEKAEEDKLYVKNLDALNGTPVLDIKPYFEADIVFSPTTPYLPARDCQNRQAAFYKQALLHHGEHCLGLELAVKMALLVEEEFGKIQSPELQLIVEGDACLADVLQGLTRARLAHPARFFYQHHTLHNKVQWLKDGKSLTLTVRTDIDSKTVGQLLPQELFIQR